MGYITHHRRDCVERFQLSAGLSAVLHNADRRSQLAQLAVVHRVDLCVLGGVSGHSGVLPPSTQRFGVQAADQTADVYAAVLVPQHCCLHRGTATFALCRWRGVLTMTAAFFCLCLQFWSVIGAVYFAIYLQGQPKDAGTADKDLHKAFVGEAQCIVCVLCGVAQYVNGVVCRRGSIVLLPGLCGLCCVVLDAKSCV